MFQNGGDYVFVLLVFAFILIAFLSVVYQGAEIIGDQSRYIVSLAAKNAVLSSQISEIYKRRAGDEKPVVQKQEKRKTVQSN